MGNINDWNEKIINQDPTDKFDNVRHVYLVDTQRGFSEEIYRLKEHGGVLIRQDIGEGLVRWCTATRWREGYEADTPVKDGLTIIAVTKRGAELFIEETFSTKWNGSGQAEKAYPFAWEGDK